MSKNTKSSLPRPITKIEGHKTQLLNEQGFRSIQQARTEYQGKTDNQIYAELQKQYNFTVAIVKQNIFEAREQEKKNKANQIKAQREANQKLTKQQVRAKEIQATIQSANEKRKQTRDKKKFDKLFEDNKKAYESKLRAREKRKKPMFTRPTAYLLHTVERHTFRPYLDNQGYFVIVNKSREYHDRATPEDILNHINEINFEDSKKIIEVISWTIEHNQSVHTFTNPSSHLMGDSFILKNNWLAFSDKISDNAFVQTQNKCVYYQIEKYLKSPPSGRPTVFLNSKRISEESLFEFFKQFASDDFNVNSGVSTLMISKLCEQIDRNMYAYDADDKCFHSVTTSLSKNYCPLVFYKMNGHLYLLDDAKAIRCVAESNKDSQKKITSITFDDKDTKKSVKLTKTEEDTKQEEEEKLVVSHLTDFPIDNIHELTEGIYILQKNSLNKDFMNYVSKYADIPKVVTRESLIVKISLKKKDGKIVQIATDANYGKNISYEKLLHVTVENKIPYINEGIGHVIHSLLNKKEKDSRKQLCKEVKEELLKRNKCAVCFLQSDVYEIDHIQSLASGGTNDITNLQVLCVDCHRMKTSIENEEGVHKVNDYRESFFNKTVWDNIISTNDFKAYQFVEPVEGVSLRENKKYHYHKIDQKKCRRNIILNSKYNFPVFSVMDAPKQFSGEIKCGLYYVETKQKFPFRGCGWYHQCLVEYGLQNSLIEISNITFELLPSCHLANDYFVAPVNQLLEKFACEPDLQKLAINAYIGMMGKSKITASFSKFSTDKKEASNWYTSSDKYSVFIRSHELDNGIPLYEGLFNQKVIQEGTLYPIYSMILQMEALELHKLETLIRNGGGIPLDRNTDAIRYVSNKKIDISSYYWDDAKTVIKYQEEEPKKLEVYHLPHSCRPPNSNKFDFTWKIKDDYEESAEETAKAIIDIGMSCHLDGMAGTGKTFLGNCLIHELKEQGKKYLAFSPTNKGARLIGGQTIHSLFYKYNTNKNVFKNIFKSIDYVFIDEVSMMVEKFYELFIMAKRLYPELIFIIIGDFGQLPPVNDSWSGDYKNSLALFDLCEGNRLQLSKCRRSDDEVFSLYKNVMKLDSNKFPKVKETYTNIAYTHKTRLRVNDECMTRYISEHQGKQCFVSRNKSNPKTQDVNLMIGMPVIAHKTDKTKNILNSEKFKVIKLENETIVVCGEGDREVTIQLEEFNKYFYIGFCITVHASQGETFKETYTIYDWNKSIFNEKAKYVAISRATRIEDIQMGFGWNDEDEEEVVEVVAKEEEVVEEVEEVVEVVEVVAEEVEEVVAEVEEVVEVKEVVAEVEEVVDSVKEETGMYLRAYRQLQDNITRAGKKGKNARKKWNFANGRGV